MHWCHLRNAAAAFYFEWCGEMQAGEPAMLDAREKRVYRPLERSEKKECGKYL